jgi:DNA polymerase-3 subunit epsilon
MQKKERGELMKILWLDTETTGLNSKENDILTLAGIVEINEEIKEEFYLEMQPFNYENISKEALEVNGLTLEQIKKFQKPQEAYKKLTRIFSKYINKYNRNDKFIISGHNIKFDFDFLVEFFLKNNDKYLGSWIEYQYSSCIDTLPLIQLLRWKKVIEVENCRLVTASKAFDVKLEDAHNALADIQATRELFYKIMKRIEIK